jgi:hypothetical protein
MLLHPKRTGKELATDTRLKPVAIFVIVYGLLQSLIFLISYLNHDYPPPQEISLFTRQRMRYNHPTVVSS